MADTIQLRIRVREDEDLDVASELAWTRQDEIEYETLGESGEGIQPQIEPVTAVLIGAGVMAAAKFVMDWWEKRRGGLVIDQRPDAPDQIYRDKDVPYGYVAVFPPGGGKVEVETKDAPKDAVERWVSEVIGGVFKSVSDLTEAAKKVAGEDRVNEAGTGANTPNN